MTSPHALWDVFCRVIDNRGDAGVCWRLARNLGLRGQRVRLWIDVPAALDGMADDDDRALQAAGSIEVGSWNASLEADFATARRAPGDRVIEAFGCEPPDAVVEALARRGPQAPPWINLEYLSAEDHVERLHGLPSPLLAGPGRGLTRWFFYPGFTARTGGLLREPGLAARIQAPRVPAQREFAVTLFHYPLPQVDAWIDELSARGAPGPLRWLRCGASGAAGSPDLAATTTDARGVAVLPWMSQSGYDRLLAAADLNVVRGEDSAVRAQWAARPFIWHFYPQADGAHVPKIRAFLKRHLHGFDGALAAGDPLAADITQAFEAWNGLAPADTLAPALSRLMRRHAAWCRHVEAWRDHLASQPDLATQLIEFAERLESRALPDSQDPRTAP